MDIPLESDVSDIPRLMAREALQKAGYAVEATAYRDNTIAVQAMIEGKLDVAVLSLPGALSAIQQGAAIKVIMAAGIQTRALAALPDIKECKDLNKKQVAVPNIVSSQTLALQRYIAKRCPGTEVDRVVIAGANNRLAALLTHRTDGAILDLMTLLYLQREDASRFNVLTVFGVEFPGMGGATVVAPQNFLDRYPETARDIVREWIHAMRMVQDPAVLKGQIEKHLGIEPGLAGIAAKAYLEQKAWEVNGGLQDGFMQWNIDFSVESGALKPGLTPAAVEDRRHLNAVLEVIGRQ